MVCSRRVYWIALAVTLTLAALLGAVPLTYSHDWDEAVFLQHAKVFVDGRTNYDEFIHRPPMLSLLYALGLTIWDNLYVAHLVQGVLAALTTLFAFLYVRAVFGLVAALVTAFLFAFTPYFVGASHDLLTDIPAVGFMLAAMWLFDKPGAAFAVLAGATYALAVQTRFTSTFLLIYFVLDVALSPKKLRNLVLLGAGAMVTIAPYFIWARLQYGGFFFPFVHARRIVTEWTAPVADTLYYDGLFEIFPRSIWLLFVVGVLMLCVQGARHSKAGFRSGLLRMLAELDARTKRQFVLLLWGGGFFVYMLSIPHKEVRYLLPLAIPVVIVSALTFDALLEWLARQARPAQAVGLILAGLAVTIDYTPAFQKLREPWVDLTVTEPVQIAEFLREASTPTDTIYAAHFFPVLALYSERRTVSLLPIQNEFEDAWREVMAQPGFLVYYPPSGIQETHAKNPRFMPDQQFIDAHPAFRLVRSFPGATVYRYEPGR